MMIYCWEMDWQSTACRESDFGRVNNHSKEARNAVVGATKGEQATILPSTKKHDSCSIIIIVIIAHQSFASRKKWSTYSQSLPRVPTLTHVLFLTMEFKVKNRKSHNFTAAEVAAPHSLLRPDALQIRDNTVATAKIIEHSLRKCSMAAPALQGVRSR